MRAGIAICEQHRMTASRRRYVCKPLHLARDRHLIDPGGPRRALERTLGIIGLLPEPLRGKPHRVAAEPTVQPVDRGQQRRRTRIGNGEQV